MCVQTGRGCPVHHKPCFRGSCWANRRMAGSDHAPLGVPPDYPDANPKPFRHLILASVGINRLADREEVPAVPRSRL